MRHEAMRQIREPHRPTMLKSVRKRAPHHDGVLLAAGTSGTGADVVVVCRDGDVQITICKIVLRDSLCRPIHIFRCV